MRATATTERPVALTCPMCGGALREDESGPKTSFSCHIGHVLSIHEMEVQQTYMVDRALAAALRALNERAEFCRRVAGSALVDVDRSLPARWSELEREVELKAEVLRNLIRRGWAELNEASDDQF